MEQGEFEASAPRAVEPSVVIKRKGSKGLLISTIIFALIAIGLGVYLVVTLMNPPKNNQGCTKEEQQEEEVADEPEEEKSDEPEEKNTSPTKKSTDARIGYVASGNCSYVYLTKSGDAYVLGGSGCQDIETSGANVKINPVSGDTGTVGNYTVNSSEIDNYFIGGTDGKTIPIEGGMKINETSIVAVAPAAIGQNWVGDIYVLVREDGAIDILYLMAQFQSASYKATLVKNAGGFKNIASAVRIDAGDHVSTVLITRNGGQIALEDTLNNWMSQNN